ncbi:hypothetical protein N431DRAFT_422530 [Stipitochalara longipes BDJ]|nr:hypothetical protein N431DRAFT_422530 [Stipitochalara longipes BDJ]
MVSSSNPLPLAWLDGDLTLSHLPKFAPRKPNRRDKSLKQISSLFHNAPKLMKKRPLADKFTTEDDHPIEDELSQHPHDLKGTMNPALVFGLQVSTLISLDRMMLQRKPASTSEDESPDSIIVQRKRARDHARLVMKQLGQRSEKLHCVKRPRNVLGDELEIFRFTELPPEIRDIIYTFYFTNSSGEKPSLMWAFKINKVKIKGDFYDSAEKIYYTVNNWSFNVRDCTKNSILGNMDDFHVGMIRKMTIEIPTEIQVCTKLSSQLSRAANTTDLTLAARADTGIRRVLHELMPGFKHLRRITLSIQRSKRASNRRLTTQNGDGTEYYKLFQPVRDMLNKAIGQEGILIRETVRVQEWRWEVDGPKVFEIICPKKHIKFE